MLRGLLSSLGLPSGLGWCFRGARSNWPSWKESRRKNLKSICQERKAQDQSKRGHSSGTGFRRGAPIGQQRGGGEGTGREGREGGPLLPGQPVLGFEFTVMQAGSKSDVCFKKINLV